MTKQIRDKEEHQRKISEDLKKDAEKQIALEKKIEEYTREMEQQRKSIDDHNKQYYDLTKAKDQCQATRKEQSVFYYFFRIQGSNLNYAVISMSSAKQF